MTVLFSRLPLQLPPGLIRSADSIVILTYWLAVDDRAFCTNRWRMAPAKNQ